MDNAHTKRSSTDGLVGEAHWLPYGSGAGEGKEQAVMILHLYKFVHVQFVLLLRCFVVLPCGYRRRLFDYIECQQISVLYF